MRPPPPTPPPPLGLRDFLCLSLCLVRPVGHVPSLPHRQWLLAAFLTFMHVAPCRVVVKGGQRMLARAPAGTKRWHLWVTYEELQVRAVE